MQHSQNFDLREPIGRHLAVFHQHRAAEIVALEEREALFTGQPVLLLRFNFLRNQRHRDHPQPSQQAVPFRRIGLDEIHLDIVGKLYKRIELRLPGEIVQSDTKA